MSLTGGKGGEMAEVSEDEEQLEYDGGRTAGGSLSRPSHGDKTGLD